MLLTSRVKGAMFHRHRHRRRTLPERCHRHRHRHRRRDPTGTLPPPPPPPSLSNDPTTIGTSRSVDLQRHTDWIKEAYSKLSEQPSVREQQLKYIAAVVERIAGQWEGKPSGMRASLVGPDGQPVTAAKYFAAIRWGALHNQRFTSYGSQLKTEVAWFNEQLANLPADPRRLRRPP